MAARKEIPRELSIYINDKAVVNSMRGITSEITRTNNEMKNLNKNSATYDSDLKKLKGNLSELQTKQSAFKDEIYATDKATKDASGSMSKLYTGLISGDLQTAKEGLSGIKAELTGLVKTSLAFIATPIGAAIAVLAGFAAGAKAIFDFNQNLEKANETLRGFNVSAEEMSQVRSEIEATAETFSKEFNDIASKANSLSKTFGISMSEANDVIAKGLANGGAQNGEFLDSLGEYDEFFSKAGYSATEFADIINKGFDLGIYSDKLPDALKEADLSLREQTKAVRDALTNAFGGSFTDDILARVTTGEITTKTALERIAAKAKESGLTQQQQAQLTADIFRGAGEDAGGALKVLEAVGVSAQKEISASTKAQLELLEANEKLNKSQAELFEIEGFGSIWDGIKAKVTDAFASALTYLSEFKNNIQPLIDLVGVALVNAWIVLKLGVSNAFDVIGGVVKIVTDNIAFGFNFVKAIITGDFLGAIDLVKNYFINLGSTVGNIFGNIKNNIINAIQGVISNVAPLLKAIGLDVDFIQKKLEGLKSKDIVVKASGQAGTATTNPDNADTKTTEEELAKQKSIRDAARQKEAEARKTAADKKQSEQDKADKIEQDKIIALAKAKEGLAKAELAAFIANERTKLDSTKSLTPEIIAEETKRLDDIRFLKENALANERLSKVEAAQSDYDSDKINAETLAALKSTIDLEYLIAEQALDLEFQATTTGLKKTYEEEQKVVNAEQLLADNELALAEATTKEEANNLKRQQDYTVELAGYKKLLDDKVITEDKYNRFVAAAKIKQSDMDTMNRAAHLGQNLQAMGQVAGALGEMFGQSKALAVVQAGINGALAITNIFATTPKVDFGFSTYALIAASGISTVAAISKILSSKAPKTPKFFYGGDTGTTAHLGFDEYGPMTGIVHKNEYVIPETMTQSPRYANTIAWLEQERVGNTRKFATGGGTSPGAVPVGSQGYSLDNEMLYGAIANLNAILARGIKATALIGYAEAESIQTLNDERNVSAQGGILNE
jgi:hypothetical protein